MTRSKWNLALLMALSIAALVLVAAQGTGSVLEGFQPTDDYVLEIDGALDPKAEIFFQRRAPAFLVLPSSQTSPLLLVPRTKAVQSVHIMKIAKNSDGSLDLLSDAVYATKAQFEIEGTSILFSLDGSDFKLGEKPPALGLKSAADLESYGANYRNLARDYLPSATTIAALRAQARDVHVRVYFGSWCPFCQRYVPRMVRIATETKGSKVRIDFYGLPKQINTDPAAREMGINSVPTAVVFVDGKEAGRLLQDDWKAPEKALKKLLG